MKQVDQNLNDWQGAADAINGTTLTDPRSLVSSLASLNASVVADIVGKATMMVFINVTVTFNAATTLIIQGTVDGTNFVQVPFFVVQSNVAAILPEQMANIIPGSTAAGSQLLVCCSTTGFKQLRVIMNTFTTAGSASVSIRATMADYRIITQPQPAVNTLSGTGTSASTTAAFLTIPAPGAGLFQYITALDIHQFVGGTAVTAAAATTISVTNFGVGAATPRWGFPNLGAIGSFQQILSARYQSPVKAFAANATIAFNFTATIAANASCIITASWYNGA